MVFEMLVAFSFSLSDRMVGEASDPDRFRRLIVAGWTYLKSSDEWSVATVILQTSELLSFPANGFSQNECSYPILPT